MKRKDDIFHIGDRVAYAQNSHMMYGYILRFEKAREGTLLVISQDKFYNLVGRPIMRRPDQVLYLED